MKNRLKYSIVIPAHNEEQNLPETFSLIQAAVRKAEIPYEFVLVNDNSTDRTREVILNIMADDPHVILVDREPPGGFGRTVRSGLEAARGDAVVLCMADSSDDPQDVVTYYHKLCEGYDCVFGSRFIKGSKVENYPIVKRLINRLVNRLIQFAFWCPFNDLSNAFKAYRMEVIRACGPYRACHFNITIEMSLGALIRNYMILQVPIRWYGRKWGISKLSLYQMGRRYLETLLMVFAEKTLIADDIFAERLLQKRAAEITRRELEHRLDDLTARIALLEQRLDVEKPHA